MKRNKLFGLKKNKLNYFNLFSRKQRLPTKTEVGQ